MCVCVHIVQNWSVYVFQIQTKPSIDTFSQFKRIRKDNKNIQVAVSNLSGKPNFKKGSTNSINNKIDYPTKEKVGKKINLKPITKLIIEIEKSHPTLTENQILKDASIPWITKKHILPTRRKGEILYKFKRITWIIENIFKKI